MTICVLATLGPDLPILADSPDFQHGPQQDFAICMLPEFQPVLSVVGMTTQCALGNCPVTLRFVDEELIWISERARTPPVA